MCCNEHHESCECMRIYHLMNEQNQCLDKELRCRLEKLPKPDMPDDCCRKEQNGGGCDCKDGKCGDRDDCGNRRPDCGSPMPHDACHEGHEEKHDCKDGVEYRCECHGEWHKPESGKWYPAAPSKH